MRRRRRSAGGTSSCANGFPPASPSSAWADTAGTAEDTIVRLTSGLFTSEVKATQAGRRRGVTKLLDWLATFPGDTWQQRWELSGVEQHPGQDLDQAAALTWLQERGQDASYDADDLASGLLMLICGDVIRPGLPWMLTRTHARLAGAMAHTRDPQGFAQLQRLAETQPASSAGDARVAATRIATHPGVQGRTRRRHHRRRLCRTGRHPAPSTRPRRAEEGRLLPAAARDRRLPRRCAAHDPRVRASHRAAHDRGTGGSIPVALPTDSRPARRLPTGTPAVAGLRQHRRDLPHAWPGCSGRASKPSHRASIPCSCPRTSSGPGRRTWPPRSATITNAAGEQIEVCNPATQRQRRTAAGASVLPRHRPVGRR